MKYEHYVLFRVYFRSLKIAERIRSAESRVKCGCDKWWLNVDRWLMACTYGIFHYFPCMVDVVSITFCFCEVAVCHSVTTGVLSCCYRDHFWVCWYYLHVFSYHAGLSQLLLPVPECLVYLYNDADLF